MNVSSRPREKDFGLLMLIAIFVGGVGYSAYYGYGYFDRHKREISKENLLRVGMACNKYAYENRNGNLQEFWPPMSFHPRPFSLDASLLDPVIADASHLNSPAVSPNKRPFDGRSYYYLGYAILDEDTGLAFIDALHEKGIESPAPFEPIETTKGEVQPLTTHIESYMRIEREQRESVSDSRSSIPRWIFPVAHATSTARGISEMPVMIEHPDLFGDGGHVLYLDGHVRFVPYPGKFPMTERFIAALESMENVDR